MPTTDQHPVYATGPAQFFFYFIGFFSTVLLWYAVVLFYVYIRVTVTNALCYDGNSVPITIDVGLAPYNVNVNVTTFM